MSGRSEAIPFGRRLDQLAAEQPESTAVVHVAEDGTETSISYRALADSANRGARLLGELGVGTESTVVIGYPNSIDHFVAAWSAWKCGALVLPLSHRLPGHERQQLLDLSEPTVTLAEWEDVPCVSREDFAVGRERHDAAPVPVAVADPGYAMGSGGSTGRSKMIVLPGPFAAVPGRCGGDFGAVMQFDDCKVQLVAGPLFHNMPFSWGNHGLFAGQTLIVLERFEAGAAVAAIERHRVEYAAIVPTMMRRIADVEGVDRIDLSSIRAVMHSGAPCPPWLKRRWIELIGADKLWEGFGGTEAVGLTVIRGDEWLEHPGSVGRAFGCDVRILDESGRQLAPGEVGEVFMRRHVAAGESYRYVGSEPATTTPDGYTSLGDLGWLDDDGYLFCADRRVDLIITGGENVYPAEVEAVLLLHPHVADAAVIGLSDDDLGRRVHAVIEPARGCMPAAEDIQAFCTERLMRYKVPRSVELVAALPRNEAGKIRRRQMVAEREG